MKWNVKVLVNLKDTTTCCFSINKLTSSKRDLCAGIEHSLEQVYKNLWTVGGQTIKFNIFFL